MGNLIAPSSPPDFPELLVDPTQTWVVPGWNYSNYANGALVTGDVYYQPIFIPESMDFDKIGLRVTATGAAGKLARLGIYEWDSGTPGALKKDAGTVDIDVATAVEVACVVTLARGYWFLASVSDDNYSARCAAIASMITVPVICGYGSSGGSAASGIILHKSGSTQGGQVAGGLDDPAVAPDNRWSAEKAHLWLNIA